MNESTLYKVNWISQKIRYLLGYGPTDFRKLWQLTGLNDIKVAQGL